MAISRSNPVSIEVVGDLTSSLSGEIDKLVKRIKDVDNDNAGWARRQEQFIKARFGKRRKKNVPWRGASNINVPLTDGIIRRWRPGISSLILDANPVAFFRALEETDLEPARTVEPFFTWLFTEHMETPPEVLRLVDLVAARGHAYVREGWRYATEEEVRVVDVNQIFEGGVAATLQRVLATDPQAQPVQVIVERLAQEYELDLNQDDEANQLFDAAARILQGAEYVRLTYRKVRQDRPDWRTLDPLDTIFDQVGDPETADFFAVIHRMDEEQIRRFAQDGYFVPSRARELLEKMESSSQRGEEPSSNRSGGAGGSMARERITEFLDRRAGISRPSGKSGRRPASVIWEVFCHLPLRPGGGKERCVLWHSPQFGVTLGTSRYSMPFPEWPITLWKFEPHAARPIDSRGIPELLSDLQKLVNAYHNARVDASQIVLAPVLKKRQNVTDFGQRIQWRPGGVVPDGIEPMVHDLRILTGLLQEEQVNQRIAEAFIGTFDATISNLEQGRERRTAAEVNAITQLASNVFGLDARMFQQSMARSFRKVWKLWQEWGPARTFFRVRNEPQPRLAIKAEIDLDYDISPAGTPSSTNRGFLLSNMERILPLVLQDQSGRFDIASFLDAYFQLIDINIAKLVTRDPEDQQAAQQINQLMQTIGSEARI